MCVGVRVLAKCKRMRPCSHRPEGAAGGWSIAKCGEVLRVHGWGDGVTRCCALWRPPHSTAQAAACSCEEREGVGFGIWSWL